MYCSSVFSDFKKRFRTLFLVEKPWWQAVPLSQSPSKTPFSLKKWRLVAGSPFSVPIFVHSITVWFLSDPYLFPLWIALLILVISSTKTLQETAFSARLYAANHPLSRYLYIFSLLFVCLVDEKICKENDQVEINNSSLREFRHIKLCKNDIWLIFRFLSHGMSMVSG